MREKGTKTRLTRGKKKHRKKTQHQKKKKEKKNIEKIHNIKEEKKKIKIISANTNLFSIEPLNANLNLFYGTRIIMTTKKIPFFCGHKKTHIEKKRYWQLVYKGEKKG